MKLLQRRWTAKDGWQVSRDEIGADHERVQLLLLFGGTNVLQSKELYKNLYEEFPNAIVAGCSTAGEICGNEVTDDSLVCTAIYFEHSTVKESHIFLDNYPHADIEEVASQLVESLVAPDLVHVFVLAEGIKINGSELVRGLAKCLPSNVGISGGLAADAYRFKETSVVADVMACSNVICVIGFYGSRLKVMTSLKTDWQEFGSEKKITKANRNILYEIDREPVLPLFEKYLGDSFREVPASSIQYPISVKADGDEEWMTRTIIGIDRKAGSLTFAGDVPHTYIARLMKTDIEALVQSAAHAIVGMIYKSFYPDFAILVSCFGRRGVMGKDSYKELNAVRAGFGEKTLLAGFYSYGEIGCFNNQQEAKLHNQTMAITAFIED